MSHKHILPLLISTGIMYITTSDNLLFRFNSTAKNPRYHCQFMVLSRLLSCFFPRVMALAPMYLAVLSPPAPQTSTQTRKHFRIYTYTSLCVVQIWSNRDSMAIHFTGIRPQEVRKAVMVRKISLQVKKQGICLQNGKTHSVHTTALANALMIWHFIRKTVRR